MSFDGTSAELNARVLNGRNCAHMKKRGHTTLSDFQECSLEVSAWPQNSLEFRPCEEHNSSILTEAGLTLFVNIGQVEMRLRGRPNPAI